MNTKNNFLLGLLAAAAVLSVSVSCSKEPADFASGGGRKIALSIEEESDETKVGVNDQSGKSVWSKGDKVAMWVTGTGANSYKDLTVNETDNTVTLDLPANQNIGYYSVYPATAKDVSNYGNTSLRVKYATSYTLPTGLTADQLNLWSPVPMVGANTDGNGPKTSVVFYHVGGMLRLKLSNYTRSDVAAIKVAFVGVQNVTGTYEVSSPATISATAALVSGTGAGNEVTFNVPAAVRSSLPAVLWLNVPLPTGDYSTLSGIRVSVQSASAPQSITYDASWAQIRHAQGKRLSVDMSGTAGALDHVSLGVEDELTLWAGETLDRPAVGYDANGIQVSDATITYTSSTPSVATVNGSGRITAVAAGSTVITVTAAKGTASDTKSYTVYVNQIRGVSLSVSEVFVRLSRQRRVTATVDYTVNGTIEQAPVLRWSSNNVNIVKPIFSSTESGNENSLEGVAVGSTTITVTLPANSYGRHQAYSLTVQATVKPFKYIPGKFTIDESGKSVFFSSGNMTYTLNTTPWDHANATWSIPGYQMGNYHIARVFGASGVTTFNVAAWATNHNSSYAHQAPCDLFSDESGYGPSRADWIAAGLSAPLHSSNDHWNPQNTWQNSSLAASCEWGIRCDDEGNDSSNAAPYTSGKWYTLSIKQWQYLLSSHQYGLGAIYVNGSYYYGTIVLPKDWDIPTGCTFLPMVSSASDNVYYYAVGDESYGPSGSWYLMENAGALFIPASGRRYLGSASSENLVDTDTYSYLWSSSISSSSDSDNTGAYAIRLGPGGMTTLLTTRGQHLSVRLVHD